MTNIFLLHLDIKILKSIIYSSHGFNKYLLKSNPRKKVVFWLMGQRLSAQHSGENMVAGKQSMSSEDEVADHIITLTRRNLSSKFLLSVTCVRQTDPAF